MVLGDLSSLITCVAYHRDRDEEWDSVQPKRSINKELMLAEWSDMWAAYWYIYEDGIWYATQVRSNEIYFAPLNHILENMTTV